MSEPGSSLNEWIISHAYMCVWFSWLYSHKQIYACVALEGLTLQMLGLLLSKAQGCKQRFLKPSKPCHVGIHWIALAEFSQMSTHIPRFQSFLKIFASFCIGQSSHQ